MQFVLVGNSQQEKEFAPDQYLKKSSDIVVLSWGLCIPFVLQTCNYPDHNYAMDFKCCPGPSTLLSPNFELCFFCVGALPLSSHPFSLSQKLFVVCCVAWTRVRVFLLMSVGCNLKLDHRNLGKVQVRLSSLILLRMVILRHLKIVLGLSPQQDVGIFCLNHNLIYQAVRKKPIQSRMHHHGYK